MELPGREAKRLLLHMKSSRSCLEPFWLIFRDASFFSLCRTVLKIKRGKSSRSFGCLIWTTGLESFWVRSAVSGVLAPNGFIIVPRWRLLAPSFLKLLDYCHANSSSRAWLRVFLRWLHLTGYSLCSRTPPSPLDGSVLDTPSDWSVPTNALMLYFLV